VKQEIEDIDTLIGNLLAGEATAEEKTIVVNWVKQSAANKDYFEHIQLIFENASSTSIQLHVDTDVAWQKVKAQLKQPKTKDINYWRVLKIAAGVVWLGFLLFIFVKNETTKKQAQVITIKTEKQTQQDTLPDGSTAFLNKKSNLLFSYDAKKKLRKVKLTGEAFFTVKHEKEKPFIIEAEDVLIKDIGTEFNVKAYAEDSIVVVSVTSGEVQFYTTNNPGLHLKAGDQGIYDRALKGFSKILKPDTNILAYKTKILSFNGSDLKSVVASLNEAYDANITIENDVIKNCQLTVTFHNDRLQTIIDVIAETLHLTVTKTQDKIILRGTGCNN
jgi:ferric-dicitrate binding protein FerR (iron transport regulator)